MSEMVERATEALLNARAGRRGAPPVSCLKALVSSQCWQQAEEDARAVIESMREPTDEMLSAGDSKMPQIVVEPNCANTGVDVLRETWPVMIDVALK